MAARRSVPTVVASGEIAIVSATKFVLIGPSAAFVRRATEIRPRDSHSAAHTQRPSAFRNGERLAGNS